MAGPLITEAIVLSTRTWSETSKIAVLYTESWGRISVLAKGAHRPKSQFAGHLEPLAVAECKVYKKPREVLHLLTGCKSMNSWSALVDDIERAAHAFALAEFLGRHTLEGPVPELYRLSRNVLDAMVDLPGAMAAEQFWSYILAALAALGFAPSLGGCGRCGRSAPPGQRVVLDVAQGRLTCQHCRVQEDDDTEPNGARRVIVGSTAVTHLRRWQQQPILTPANSERLTTPVIGEIAGVLGDLMTFHLGGSMLKSLRFARRIARRQQPDTT